MEKIKAPFTFQHAGRWYVFVSTHPLEERTVCLDDLPRDRFGSIILPNEPWDGVETCPGMVIGTPAASDDDTFTVQ